MASGSAIIFMSEEGEGNVIYSIFTLYWIQSHIVIKIILLGVRRDQMDNEAIDGLENWKIISCEPDIILKIISYLSFRDINNLETSAKIFEHIFDEANVLKTKIKKEFHSFKLSDEIDDQPRELYWQLKYIGHYCDKKCYNLCNVCLIATHCFNITKCEHCDSSSYFLPN